jgi:hypothetical protein
MHGYEIEYLFGMPWINHGKYDDEDRIISRQMINNWAEFARYGRLSREYDQSVKSNFFITFSSPLSPQKNRTNEEYHYFNREFLNCKLLNDLDRDMTYSTKYERCLAYKKVVSSTSNLRINIYTLFSILFSVYSLLFSFIFP